MYDINDEMYLSRFGNGIKLLKSSHNYFSYTVGKILQLPCSVFFESYDGVIVKINDHNADFCGFNSANQAKGKIYYSSFTKQSSAQLRKNDIEAMKFDKFKIFEESIQHRNNTLVNSLSIKLPWYNNNNKLIGLFGFAIAAGENSLADSLSMLINIGFFNTVPSISRETYKLTKQQQACAKLLIQGNTIKEISNQLILSSRTVETYLNNLKHKLHCNNKTELIIKLSDLLKTNYLN